MQCIRAREAVAKLGGGSENSQHEKPAFGPGDESVGIYATAKSNPCPIPMQHKTLGGRSPAMAARVASRPSSILKPIENHDPEAVSKIVRRILSATLGIPLAVTRLPLLPRAAPECMIVKAPCLPDTPPPPQPDATPCLAARN